MTLPLLTGVAIVAYGIGSVPFGLLLTRASGLGDIRAIGSGNIGATNVLRTGRKDLAALTLALDAAKGVLAVLGARVLVPATATAPHDAAVAVAAVAVVLGHCAPVSLRFRGGKGVATGLGALCGLDWRVGALAVAAWIAAAAASRRSSAGALAAFASGTVAAVALLPDAPAIAAAAVTLLVFARHRANIGRLLAGTEPAIGRRA